MATEFRKLADDYTAEVDQFITDEMLDELDKITLADVLEASAMRCEFLSFLHSASYYAYLYTPDKKSGLVHSALNRVRSYLPHRAFELSFELTHRLRQAKKSRDLPLASELKAEVKSAERNPAVVRNDLPEAAPLSLNQAVNYARAFVHLRHLEKAANPHFTFSEFTEAVETQHLQNSSKRWCAEDRSKDGETDNIKWRTTCSNALAAVKKKDDTITFRQGTSTWFVFPKR